MEANSVISFPSIHVYILLHIHTHTHTHTHSHTHTHTVPPFFLREPPPKDTVDIGREIAFTCLAHGFPLPTYTWFHNGVQIVGDSRVHLENGTLTITKARKDDRGYYTCVVQNEGGTIRSETMLKVYGECRVSV